MPYMKFACRYIYSWVPKNWWFWTVVLEKTLESPLDCKEIQPVHPKGNQSWVFTGGTDCWGWNSNTLATWWGELTHLKRPWCWERLRVGGEMDDRGWDGWMASPTQWKWVWADSGSWRWPERPGMLWFMGSQRVGQVSATELNVKKYGILYMPNMKIEVLIICMKCGISYMSHNRILLTYANLDADSQIEDI